MTLEDLMRFSPRCEAEVKDKQCSSTATHHIKVTHTKRSDVQEADLCSPHLKTVVDRAKKQGYTVTTNLIGM